MAYFSLTDPNNPVDDTNKIVYNYFSTQINKSAINLNPDDNGDDTYLQTVFPNTSPTNNLIYTGNNQKNYGTTNLYIYGLLHNNISNVTSPNSKNIIGELVLEHIMPGGTAYSCFFLTKNADSTAPTNDIDNIYYLLNDPNSLSSTVTLNNIITTQSNCIIYNSDNNTRKTVFVFTTPLQVNASSASAISKYIKTTSLFNINAPTHYSFLSQKNISHQQDEEIYIDCNPSGVSNSDIQTYNIPINSELSQEKQNMDFMKTTVNFFVFIVGLAFCYFAVPKMYKTVVVDNAILFNKKYPQSIFDVWQRIRSADIWLTLIISVLFLTMLILGFTDSNYTYITTGLFICVFYGLSFSIIQNSKMDKEFMTLRNSEYTIFRPYEAVSSDAEPIEYFNLKDYFQLFVQSITFFIKECIPAWIGVVIMFLILLIFAMLSVYGTDPGKWVNFIYYSTIGPFVVLPIFVCIIKMMLL